ncbi:MAG TPA: hypothetical protein VHU23_10630 [Rhizomicrobium sp.]|jgi:hypothetical protein|nr:hypothetical protein [Rhizomicrobium sp.]
MNKACWLAAISVLTLSAQGNAAAMKPLPNFFGGHDFGNATKGAKLLYNQNSNGDGDAVGSQNFTSGKFPSSDDAGADDFVVPKNTKWKVTEVDATGYYYNGTGPAASENVIFYEDDYGVPGKAVKNGTFVNLVGEDENGSFAIALPRKGLTLKPGTYWVSVVANCSYTGACGEWAWELSPNSHGNQPMWEKPASTTRCITWTPIETCFGYPGDLEFALRGKAKRN